MNAEIHLLRIRNLCALPYPGENERGRELRESILASLADDGGREATDQGLRTLRIMRGIDQAPYPRLGDTNG